MDLKFQVHAQCSKTHARRGSYETTHGTVETPVFMPVGTQGSVKALSPEELTSLGATVILGNTYHLGLRPGVETLKALGGMHTMYNWSGSILTDSGGFQVLSLSKFRKVSEEGFVFRSHHDVSLLNLTPEKAVEIQAAIGSDIMMCLDHLGATDAPRREVEDAMARTTRWASRCLEARTRDDQALFAIIQGGTEKDLRTRHVEELCSLPFDGFAVGGLSVGESIPEMYETLLHTAPQMPKDKPRYLMGWSTLDLVEGVARGIDMFDCVMPTRNARKEVFVDRGRAKLNIRNARFQNDTRPIDEACPCYTCANYSRGFIRHQLKAGELLAFRLLTIHNLAIYLNLMDEIRTALSENRFDVFYQEYVAGLDSSVPIC